MSNLKINQYSHSYPIHNKSRLEREREKHEKSMEKGGTRRFPKMIRQYTFTCEQDFIDISEGFCPRYALYWLDEYNKAHWPEGTVIRHREEYLKKKDVREAEKKGEIEKKEVHFDLFREIIPIFDEFVPIFEDNFDDFHFYF